MNSKPTEAKRARVGDLALAAATMGISLNHGGKQSDFGGKGYSGCESDGPGGIQIRHGEISLSDRTA